MSRPADGADLAISCYQAGYDGFRLGVLNYVIDPASLQVDRRTRRNKTDGVDVAYLLRPLMAYPRGEPKVWSNVRVPSVAEEDDRRPHRERDRLLNERNQHVSRIKGLLAIQGIYDFEPMHAEPFSRAARCAVIRGSVRLATLRHARHN